MKQARCKYSVAFSGGAEANTRAQYDTWTYPMELGREVLHQAFVAAQRG
jgi:hypothetical protein